MSTTTPKLDSELQRIVTARHHDPFAVLGKHRYDNTEIVRVFMPGAEGVTILPNKLSLQRIPDTDLFEWQGKPGIVPDRYQVEWQDKNGQLHSYYDPYCFPPQIGDLDLHLFGEGKHRHIYRVLGAHLRTVDDVLGVAFGVWAPNAERVSVVGDFNNWDGRNHPMRVRGGSGVWELFIPGLPGGTLYKFEIRNRNTGNIFVKSDPYGRSFEHRPQTSSYVTPEPTHTWQDADWMQDRAQRDWLHVPMSVYEVHLGSWVRDEEGHFPNYRELAHKLVEYVCHLGFTHIELLPVSEHPLDASWGYQVTGFYAPTSRFGSPDDFRYFVDYCHRHNIGVILDWVPAHFPKDAHGLAWFDGTALYEYGDPRKGEHRDWGTLIFNYGRHEVKNFLISNAFYWLDEFHIDALRVDAVASILYLDYSRKSGEWVPNKYGGNQNLEAIDFLRELNAVTHSESPGSLMIAEESTSWAQVTRPAWVGGLGFSMKWNMGWMHDTLVYMSKNPVHRIYHHDSLTFGMLYAYTENFVLPFSHDEVTHGKRSMLDKMPGDAWQKFANLRLLYTYMWTYPGKKLLFMGCEFGQGVEWNHAQALSWELLSIDYHAGVHAAVKDLNHLYQRNPALHQYDFEGKGFSWIDCHDAAQSIISYMRHGDNGEDLVIILNFTPVPRGNYRIGVDQAGVYKEIFNSDSSFYGGSNVGNCEVTAQEPGWMGKPYSISLTLPPLAGIILRRKALEDRDAAEIQKLAAIEEQERIALEELRRIELEQQRKAAEELERQELEKERQLLEQQRKVAEEQKRRTIEEQQKLVEQQEFTRLERERKALEEARKALEKEQQAVEEQRRAVEEQKRLALEKERATLEKERKLQEELATLEAKRKTGSVESSTSVASLESATDKESDDKKPSHKVPPRHPKKK